MELAAGTDSLFFLFQVDFVLDFVVIVDGRKPKFAYCRFSRKLGSIDSVVLGEDCSAGLKR